MSDALPARILLVDDDARNLLVLQSVLAELGEPMVTARSGEAALKRVLEEDFAVILLDIQMPGMDGFEAAMLIRQRERSSRTPIVFLTALHDQEFVDRGYLAGAVDFMFKPIQPAILRSKVSVFIDLYRKTDEVRSQAAALHDLQQREHARQLDDQKRAADLVLQDARHELRQAQKMEAIGNLAGGIAHDFNNLLTVIRGYVGLMLDSEATTGDMRANAEAIRDASDRAAALTQQLLAFSRKQVMRPRPVDLNAIIHDVNKLLVRVLGEHVQLQTQLQPDVGPVLADPVHVQQILMNLAINARDAMPQGGRLLIRTAQTSVAVANGDPQADGMEAMPANLKHHCVVLTVSDDGAGMDEATRLRVFEPFFTTKAMGKGTGLGLATVYGIVKQSGGHIWVESQPGHGATFHVALPLAAVGEEPASLPVASPVASTDECHETVLVAEDEAPLRELVRRVLEGAGYTVLVAPDGVQGLALCESFSGPIDLLLTDVVMPGMDGRELGRRAAELRPKMGILFMSGYMDDALREFGVVGSELQLLQKPFSSQQLLHSVRTALNVRGKPA